MSENFNELKRLFDAECERLAQIATERMLRRYGRETATEEILWHSEREGAAITLAALLEGRTISSACSALTEAKGLFDNTHTVSAAAIYSKFDSGQL